jgi:hypothetical protein
MSCTGRAPRRGCWAAAPQPAHPTTCFLATHFGGLFVCALMQRAEDRSPYESDADATDTMRPTSGSR